MATKSDATLEDGKQIVAYLKQIQADAEENSSIIEKLSEDKQKIMLELKKEFQQELEEQRKQVERNNQILIEFQKRSDSILNTLKSDLHEHTVLMIKEAIDKILNSTIQEQLSENKSNIAQLTNKLSKVEAELRKIKPLSNVFGVLDSIKRSSFQTPTSRKKKG